MSTPTRLPTRNASATAHIPVLKPADTGDWRDDAECRTADPETFFPVGGSALAKRQTLAAKAVCGRCPVRIDCLDWAVATKQVSGVWGGLAEDERLELIQVQGDAAWAACLNRQEYIEERRAQGVPVRSLARELGVAYEMLRKVIKYIELERSTLAAVGGEGA